MKSLKMEAEEDVYDELREMIQKKATKFDKIEDQEEAVEVFQEPETQIAQR